MTTAHAAHPPHSPQPGAAHSGPSAVVAWPKGLVVDMATIDLSQRLLSRRDLEKTNAHRGDMALLDGIVWRSSDLTQAVALWNVKATEFWVPGHFPGRPMLPGVLQVEAGAQLAVHLYNARHPTPLSAAFTRIENCSFRNIVVPGDTLYVLCKEIKWSRRGFACHVQGVTNQKLTFEAEVQGLAI